MTALQNKHVFGFLWFVVNTRLRIIFMTLVICIKLIDKYDNYTQYNKKKLFEH